MKYLDPLAGAVALVLRLLWIPIREAPGDWIAVVALFWIARGLASENSRARDLILAGTGLWLTGLYAWSQGPHLAASF